MPREDRYIFFDYEEVYKAIYGLCSQKGLPKPPAGTIMDVAPSIESPFDMNIVYENHKTAGIDTERYTKDFIVAALMILCRSIGIPLPKGANKSLELIPEKVVLRVQMIR